MPLTWAQCFLRSEGVRSCKETACKETACAVQVPTPGTAELPLRVVPSPRQTVPAVHDGKTAASGLRGQDTRQRRPHRQTPSVLGAVAAPPPRSGPPASRCGCPHAGLPATHSPCFPRESQQTRFSKCGSHRKTERHKQTPRRPLPTPASSGRATLWIIPARFSSTHIIIRALSLSFAPGAISRASVLITPTAQVPSACSVLRWGN